jgi:glycosyltransferase involved in cell wall biosynthesis
LSKSASLNNLFISDGFTPVKHIFFHFGELARKIKAFQPDLVISSLQYSLGIKRYKRLWNNATYVQVLHGMPCPINGRFKAWAINKVARFSRKHFDKLVTVSFLSYAINKKINLIECDRIIHNGCALVPPDKETARVVDFVYVGRLFRDKEVELIADAFCLLKERDPNVRVVVAGYGELEPLFTSGRFKDSGIDFVGKLSQKEVRSLLQQSKFFISMNPLEPFGTVFNEAVMNGCNIVTQSTTGSCSLFVNKAYFHIADCITPEELCARLFSIRTLYIPISPLEKNRFIEYMSFKRCANEYKELCVKR